MGSCDKCSLSDMCANPLQLGKGKKGAKIMIVADCPSDEENANKTVFGDKGSKNLKSSLERRGIDLKDVYFTYAVKCSNPEDKEPKSSSLKACKEYLDAEIEIINPKIIVPLGNIACKAVLGQTGITKLRGKAIEQDGIIILPTIHPRAALKLPGYKTSILKDLDTLEKLYREGMNTVTGVDYKIFGGNPKEIIEWLDYLEHERLMKGLTDWLCYDLETTGLDDFRPDSKIVCMSLSDLHHTGGVIPLRHRESPLTGKNLDLVLDRIRKLMANPNIGKGGHHSKFDMKWLKNAEGIYVANNNFDTMDGHYLAITEEKGTHGLKTLAWEMTDMGGYDNELDEYKQTLPEAERNNYDNIPWHILSKYAVADVDCPHRLRDIIKPLIDDNPKWTWIMDNIYGPARYAFAQVETWGMCLQDEDFVSDYQKAYNAEQARLEERMNSYPEVLELEREKLEMYAKRQAMIKSIPKKDRTEEQQAFIDKTGKYKNYQFNWKSVPQVGELLFGKLGLHTEIRTETGNLSTGEDALTEMASQHELPAIMLDYRKITTLNGMFIAKIPEMKDENNIVHPKFQYVFTVTCRTTSENPNAQQFPRKVGDPTLFQYRYEPKKLFTSRFGEDGCVVNADFSQLEVRIAGIISNDEIMTQMYIEGMDIHRATAATVYKIPVSEVTDDQRSNAKGVVFGTLYGKSEYSYARELFANLPFKEGVEAGRLLIKGFLGTFPSVGKWLKETKEFAYEHGYTENLFGFRRHLPNLRSKDKYIRSEAERQAINAPIQGSGSYMTLLALNEIVDWLVRTKKKSVIMCTVHDSIVADIYLPELPEVSAYMKWAMENMYKKFIDHPLPILAELELGDNYGNQYGIETCEEITNKKLFKEWIEANNSKKKLKAVSFLKDKCNMEDSEVLSLGYSNDYLTKYYDSKILVS